MISLPDPRRTVRSVFVSDLHLGCRYANASGFLDFLRRCEPEHLYLVGDIIDGWRLRRRWRWLPVYDAILRRIWELAERGVQVRYAPGNHDDFLRNFLHNFHFIDIADEFTHETADGRRCLVTHGDLFDAVERRAPWLSMLGAAAYDSLLWLNHTVNDVRRGLRLPDVRFSTAIKQRVKSAVRFVSDFEQQLAAHAQGRQCDTVVCGHIHTPALRPAGDVLYCNTGDWVEHSTALLEHHDGALEIVRMCPRSGAWLSLASQGARRRPSAMRGVGQSVALAASV